MPVVVRLKNGNLLIANKIKEIQGSKMKITSDGTVICNWFVEDNLPVNVQLREKADGTIVIANIAKENQIL